MTNEEKLCEISDVLRRHNKPEGGISHSEAVYLIKQIVDSPNAEEQPIRSAYDLIYKGETK